MTAGWYPDPSGGPDQRWWDGSQWTDSTRPAAAAAVAGPVAAPAFGPPPGPPPGTMPGTIPPGPPPGMAPPPGMGPLGSGPVPPAPAGDGNRRNVLIVVGALVVGALVVGAAFVLRGDDDETGGGPSTTERSGTTRDDATTTTEGGTAPVGEEFVSAGGLTFTRLPEPWQDWVEGGNRQLPELQPTAGQFVVVQETTPSGGGWIGNIVIGDLTPDISYDGEADLPTAARELSTQLIETYYVEGSPTTIVNETAVTVDGHPGYFVHNEVSLSQEGLETTQEKVVVVVVDTGRARPGAFYASIPYNRADLNDGMDQAYRSLVVNE